MLSEKRFSEMSYTLQLRHMAQVCGVAIEKCRRKILKPARPVSIEQHYSEIEFYLACLDKKQDKQGEGLGRMCQMLADCHVKDYTVMQNTYTLLQDYLLGLSGLDVSEKDFDICQQDDVTVVAHKEEIYVILDNLRSAFNVGSILRTCDAACVKEVYFCGYTAKPGTDKLEKTALGATNDLVWHHVDSPLQAIEQLKAKGVKVYAFETAEPSEDLFAADLSLPMAIVVGNESLGLSPAVLHACDGCLRIPMFGTKNSLNVSCAFSIGLYATLERSGVLKRERALSHAK